MHAQCTSLKAARDLISTTNVYLKSCDKLKVKAHGHVLKAVASYLTELLRLFGVIVSPQTLGFPVGQQQQALEDKVMPDLLRFADLRERIRRRALERKGGEGTPRVMQWGKGSGAPAGPRLWSLPRSRLLISCAPSFSQQTRPCSRPATASAMISCPTLACGWRTRRTVRVLLQRAPSLVHT